MPSEGQPNTTSQLKTIRPERGLPFNHPSAVTCLPDGNLYVSDGYVWLADDVEARAKLHRRTRECDGEAE